jgi:MEDS: MEthanogen/methylotroph, DcmR Sensory domain
MVYNGAPNRHLRAVSLAASERLATGYRCIYLNSVPMIAGFRSYLAATGVDVEDALARASLILSSHRPHLVNGGFDVTAMLQSLDSEITRALELGYAGLWATGDMTWELGPGVAPEQLVEYERGLEELFQRRPEFAGVCQYHTETLPTAIVETALRVHPSLFINETLSLLNPYFVQPVASV